MRKILPFFKVSLLLLFFVSIVAGQETCESLLETAFAQAEANCVDVGLNEVCYGYDSLEALFVGSAEETVVAEPEPTPTSENDNGRGGLPGRGGRNTDNSDTADTTTTNVSASNLLQAPGDMMAVNDMMSVHASSLNLDAAEWGIATFNIQANLPSTLYVADEETGEVDFDGRVALVLLGDMQIENAVNPEEAYTPHEGLEVFVDTLSGGNVRTSPTTAFQNVIGGAGYESTWLADGRTANSEWVRIPYNGRPAWLSTIVLEDNPAIADLPVVWDAELPPTTMQSFFLRAGASQSDCEEAPDNLLFVQTPDNLDVQLTVNGADVTISSSGAFRIVEIDGEFFLEIIVFDGEFEVGDTTVRRGEHTFMCLGEEDNLGTDGQANDRMVECAPDTPTRISEADSGVYCNLEGLPTSLLNYRLNVLCPGEAIAGGGGGGSANATAAGDSEIAGVDCSNFTITTEEIVNGNFTLSWTAAEGADLYRVAVYDLTDFNVSNHETTATSIGVNGGESFPPSGYVDVRAFKGGAYACTARLTYERLDTTSSGGSFGGSGSDGPPGDKNKTYKITITNYSSCNYSGYFGPASVVLPAGGSVSVKVPGGTHTYNLTASGCTTYGDTVNVNSNQSWYIPA